MTTKNNGGPAFPVWELNGNGQPEMTGFGLSLRQYAAIKLRVPDSGTDWLDDMIRQSVRTDLAAKAMQGLCANPGGPIQANGMNGWNLTNCTGDDVADVAYAMADAMLKAREEA